MAKITAVEDEPARIKTAKAVPPKKPSGKGPRPPTEAEFLATGLFPDPKKLERLTLLARIVFPLFAFTLLVPTILLRILVIPGLDYSPNFNLKYVLFGVLAWYIGLSSRLPFRYFEKKISPQSVGGGALTFLMVGICETFIRGTAMYWWPTLDAAADAAGPGTRAQKALTALYSLGIGWAAGECLAMIGRLAARMSLYRRKDERAIFAKTQLMTLERTHTFVVAPVAELTSTLGNTLLHVGLTLLVGQGRMDRIAPVALAHSFGSLAQSRFLAWFGPTFASIITLIIGLGTFLYSLTTLAATGSQYGEGKSSSVVGNQAAPESKHPYGHDWDDEF
ncbi:hypothetical protein DFS34DRAFT_628700 [Phlyctochytrium arcticum]|nr:hypothetical protein DFS34DRAFT_628700 [Phlyctochytrium arcticum]